MSKTVVYIRVSTTSQNIDGQQMEIKKWLENNQIVDAQWFVDRSSGTTIDRPAFINLQKAIFDGEVQTVVIWRLDRLSRNLKDGINILTDWLEQGIRVVSISQMLDFSASTGKVMAAFLLGLGEMEMETRRERQMIGIAAAKEKGVYTGRQRGTYKAKPSRAKALKEKGVTIPEIAQFLGVCERTVFRYLEK